MSLSLSLFFVLIFVFIFILIFVLIFVLIYVLIIDSIILAVVIFCIYFSAVLKWLNKLNRKFFSNYSRSYLMLELSFRFLTSFPAWLILKLILLLQRATNYLLNDGGLVSKEDGHKHKTTSWEIFGNFFVLLHYFFFGRPLSSTSPVWRLGLSKFKFPMTSNFKGKA